MQPVAVASLSVSWISPDHQAGFRASAHTWRRPIRREI